MTPSGKLSFVPWGGSKRPKGFASRGPGGMATGDWSVRGRRPRNKAQKKLTGRHHILFHKLEMHHFNRGGRLPLMDKVFVWFHVSSVPLDAW